MDSKDIEKSANSLPDETTSLTSQGSSHHYSCEDTENGAKPTFIPEQMSDGEKSLFWWWVTVVTLWILLIASVICFATLEWRKITVGKLWSILLFAVVHLTYVCICQSFISYIKQVWMLSIGLSRAEVLAIYGTATLNLPELLKKGDQQIGICDGVTRKCSHLAHNVGLMLFWKYIVLPAGPQVIVLASSARDIVAIGILMLLRRKSFCVTDWIFWGTGSRVKDGYLRRENSIVGNLGAGFTKLLMLLVWHVHFTQIFPPSTHADILLILMIPFTIGDAMAEIVGVTLGSRKFPVYGFGEINIKSVEGCGGCFVFTLVPICGLLFFQGYGWLWYIMAFVIALVTTVLETWSPRSTDNITIIVGSMIILHLFQPVLITGIPDQPK